MLQNDSIFTPELSRYNKFRSFNVGSVGGKEGVVEDKRLSHISWILLIVCHLCII